MSECFFMYPIVRARVPGPHLKVPASRTTHPLTTPPFPRTSPPALNGGTPHLPLPPFAGRTHRAAHSRYIPPVHAPRSASRDEGAHKRLKSKPTAQSMKQANMPRQAAHRAERAYPLPCKNAPAHPFAPGMSKKRPGVSKITHAGPNAIHRLPCPSFLLWHTRSTLPESASPCP